MLNEFLYILETELSYPYKNASYLVKGSGEAEKLRLELMEKGCLAERNENKDEKYDVIIAFEEIPQIETSLSDGGLIILVNCPKSFKTSKKSCKVIEIYNKRL